MNRADLIEDLANYELANKAAGSCILDRVLDTIHNALVRGEDVSLPGLGRLFVAERAASEGTNPRTSEKIKIPAKRVVKFRAALVLSRALNRKDGQWLIGA